MHLMKNLYQLYKSRSRCIILEKANNYKFVAFNINKHKFWIWINWSKFKANIKGKWLDLVKTQIGKQLTSEI
jgi:hypothetical protein